MNPLEPLRPLAGPLLYGTLQMSLLIAVALMLRAALGRWMAPRWRCALWAIVLLRLAWPAAPDRLWQRWTMTTPPPMPVVATPAAPSVRPAAEPAVEKTRSMSAAEPPLIFATPRAGMPSDIPPLLVAVWLLGVLISLLRVVVVQARLRRLLRSLPPLRESRVSDVLDTLSAEMRVRRFCVVACEPDVSPAVAGLFRPTLILPRELTERLTPEQLRLVLTHELLHIRRLDVLWRWTAAVAVAVQWFNPLVRFARSRFLIDCELATDAAVLRRDNKMSRHSYGEALLTIASWATTQPPVGAIGVLERSSVRARINAIARPARSSVVAGVAAALIAGCTLVPQRQDARAGGDDRLLEVRSYDVRDLLISQIDPLVSNIASSVSTTPSDPPPMTSAPVDTKIFALIAKTRRLVAQGDFVNAENTLSEVLHLDPQNAYAVRALPLVRQQQSTPPEQARQLSSELFTDPLPNEQLAVPPTTEPIIYPADPVITERSAPEPATKPSLGIDLHREAAFDQSASLSQRLIETIQQQVDSPSWKSHGGSVGEIATLNGQLIVTQTEVNQQLIQALLNRLRHANEAMVLIETRFLQGHVIADALRVTLHGSASLPIAGQLTASQVERLQQLVQHTDSTTMLVAPRILAVNGQRASVAVTTDTPFVSSLTTLRDDAHTMAAFQPTVDIFTSGVSLLCQAVIADDHQSITLTSCPQITWLRRLAQKPIFVPSTAPNGTDETAYYDDPIAENSSLELTATVPDGGTYAIAYQPTITPADANEPTPEPVVVLMTLHIQPTLERK